jgi:hypothetical protein
MNTTDTVATTERATQALAERLNRGGYWVGQAVYAATVLGVPEVLAEEGASGAELADRCGAHPDALVRLLRALALCDVVVETAPGHFELGAAGRALLGNTGRPLRDLLAAQYGPWTWRAWGGLVDSITSGKPAFPAIFGDDYFDYLARDPHAARVFQAGMRAATASIARVVAESIPLGSARTLVDVGGGNGELARGVLEAHQEIAVTIFDLPHVLGQMEAAIPARLRGRLELVGGDFFADVLPAADAYVLCQILHDWEDDAVVALLLHVREAMPTGARLFVVEAVAPEPPAPNPGAFVDLLFLVLMGGRQRRRSEFKRALGAAGLALLQVVPVPDTGVSILVAEPR